MLAATSWVCCRAGSTLPAGVEQLSVSLPRHLRDWFRSTSRLAIREWPGGAFSQGFSGAANAEAPVSPIVGAGQPVIGPERVRLAGRLIKLQEPCLGLHISLYDVHEPDSKEPHCRGYWTCPRLAFRSCLCTNLVSACVGSDGHAIWLARWLVAP